MEREKLFRGQTEKGEWVEGSYYYAKKSNQHFIVIEEYVGMAKFHRVDPKTVGEFSGLPDKNGKKIFEGDYLLTDEAGWRAKVIFRDGMFMLVDNNDGFSTYVKWSDCEIIGNQFDTPELLNNLK